MGVKPKIEKLVRQDPQEVIDRLQLQPGCVEPDMAYWEAVREQVIHPYLAVGTQWGSICTKYDINPDEAYTHLYELFARGHKFDDLRDKRQVVEYLKQAIRNFVKAKMPKEPSPEPSKTAQAADSKGGKKKRKRIPKPVITPDESAVARAAVCRPALDHLSAEDDRRRARVHAGAMKYWQEKPKRALVALLRCKGLSAKEIASFLQVVSKDSENYIRQVIHLAIGDMRQGCRLGDGGRRNGMNREGGV